MRTHPGIRLMPASVSPTGTDFCLSLLTRSWVNLNILHILEQEMSRLTFVSIICVFCVKSQTGLLCYVLLKKYI